LEYFMSITINGTTGISANATGFLVGQIGMFAMSSAPTGWLKCNGALISRTTYSALFTAISTAYGVGDGSTTFGLPDLRGEFIRGWDDGRGIDSGRALNSTPQLDQFQSHLHGVGATAGPAGTAGYISAGAGHVSDSTSPSTDGANGTPRVGTETRPRNIALLMCIFTGV
jgi:microcystin-dependent protein